MYPLTVFTITLLFILGVSEVFATSPTEIERWCKKYKYDKCELVQAIIKSESSYNPNAFVDEKSGSYGLMMVQCDTAKDPRLDSPLKYSCDQLFDPQINVRFGIMYLKMIERVLLVKSPRNIIAAYNAGFDSRKRCGLSNGVITLTWESDDECVLGIGLQPRVCRDHNVFKYKGFPAVECYPGEFINEEYVWKVYRRYNYLVQSSQKRSLK